MFQKKIFSSGTPSSKRHALFVKRHALSVKRHELFVKRHELFVKRHELFVKRHALFGGSNYDSLKVQRE